MNKDADAPHYYVWSSKNTSEGPFELPALVTRIKSGQVGPKTWIFSDADGTWGRAESISELGVVLPRSGPKKNGPGGVDVRLLERIKVFAGMSRDHLDVFARYGEILTFRQFTTVVQKGEHGDSMFSVIDGELRARSLVDGRESTLSTMGPGESFGEISLLDHGPRSVDVLANKDSTVFKISSAVLEKILREEPAAAAPFLFGLGRTEVARIRALTKRYEDSIQFARAGAKVDPGAEP